MGLTIIGIVSLTRVLGCAGLHDMALIKMARSCRRL